MRLLRQTEGKAGVENMWTEIPARPKGQGTAGQGGRGEPGETSENRGGSAHAAADPRPRSPKRGLTTAPRAQAAPAGLTPEQSERLGFGDEHQGVHGRQVEQAHQDDVPPDDVLPLPACARPLQAAAARRALDPRTDSLCGGAEGDFAPVRGPAWHGWGEVGAGGSDSEQAELCWRGALRWGRGLLPFRGDLSTSRPAFPALLWFLLYSAGVQRGLRMHIWEPGICCWRVAHAAAALNSAARKRGRAREEGGARRSWGRGRGSRAGRAAGEAALGGSPEERPA